MQIHHDGQKTYATTDAGGAATFIARIGPERVRKTVITNPEFPRTGHLIYTDGCEQDFIETEKAVTFMPVHPR
jgi:hypothetical protein